MPAMIQSMPSRAPDLRVVRAAPARTLGAALLRKRLIDARTLAWAEERERRNAASMTDILLRHAIVSEADLVATLAELGGFETVDLSRRPPDAVAMRRLGPGYCAAHQIVPLARAGAVTPVATPRPDRFGAIRDEIAARIGPVAPVAATATAVETAIQRHSGRELARLAETRCPDRNSCRSLSGPAGRRIGALCGVLLAAAGAAGLAFPGAIVPAICILAFVVALVNSALLGTALVVTMHRPGLSAAGSAAQPVLARQPRVSLLLPLRHEGDIAAKLMERIAALDYPRELLDVILVIESDDDITPRAIAAAHLPPWVRTLTVGPGQIRTKPRAMNMALDFCRGSIIGIYDAEDKPESRQIRDVVERFARSGPRVACLQGRLNFYNIRHGWITRCFAIDYAIWFWVVLPALRRLGWPVPLGGTTVFFRRDALEAVGAWDAHNVTEDADLGIRLARAGYVTDLIDTVTLEEASASPRAWIKQRSRWQKGYAITWASQMRDPRALWRDLGPWGFFGLQVLLLGSLSGALLAPVLWSFWLISFGLPHPFVAVSTPLGQLTLLLAFLAIFSLNAAAGVLALVRQDRLGLVPWLPVMHVYYPLATISILKALWEVARRPFYWDKTEHGVSRPDDQPAGVPSPTPSPAPESRAESCFSRVS